MLTKKINLSRDLSIDDYCKLIVLDQNLKLKIVDQMNMYGGSFVKALSACIVLADPINLRKLAHAFFEYFIKYSPKEWETKHYPFFKFDE